MSTESNGQQSTPALDDALGVYIGGTVLVTVHPARGTDSRMGGLSSIPLIATFLAAIQVAMLSMMNDLLSKESVDAQLFQVQPGAEGSRRYTFYSLGMMLGTIAQWVYTAVAVMSTIRQLAPSVRGTQGHPAFDAVILFISLCTSCTSLVLLYLAFDLAFGVVLTAVCLCILSLVLTGILRSADAARTMVTLDWKDNALRILSLSGLGPVFGLSVNFPAPPVWCSFSLVAATLAYHLLSYMPGWADEEDGVGGARPRKRCDIFSGFLCMGWAACAVFTAAWDVHNHKDNDWAQWTIVAIAICEAVWMGIRAALSFSLHSWLAGFWDKLLAAVSMRYALPR